MAVNDFNFQMPPPDLSMLGRPAPNAFSTGHRANRAFQGLLGNTDLALALLAQSGGPVRRSFGEIVGNAGLQVQAMQQQRQQDALRQQLLQAQIRNFDEPNRGVPSAVQEYEYARKNGYTGSFQDWTVMGGQSSRPSSVQEWEFFNKLGPEEQRRYLEMKRNPNFKVQDVLGAPTVVTGTPGGGVQTTPLSTTQAEIDAAARRKAAEAQAGAVGTGQGSIIADIQKKGANARVVMDTLDIADSLIDASTGSLVGAGVDRLASVFGVAPKGAQAAAQLKVLQAGLMLNMPRMEGPQSDRDVELYRQAAASLGDDTVPNDVKKAAVRTIRQLQQKYAERAQQPFKLFPNGTQDSEGWTVLPGGIRVREKK